MNGALYTMVPEHCVCHSQQYTQEVLKHCWDAADLREVVAAYKKLYTEQGLVIPDDPHEQLRLAIGAVFGSWNTPRAVKYREINRVTGLKGTAVNVQAMVYGNFNDESGTGVCFTRNPSSGKKEMFGEFLVNAQGEDVVAGAVAPSLKLIAVLQ